MAGFFLGGSGDSGHSKRVLSWLASSQSRLKLPMRDIAALAPGLTVCDMVEDEEGGKGRRRRDEVGRFQF